MGIDFGSADDREGAASVERSWNVACRVLQPISMARGPALERCQAKHNIMWRLAHVAMLTKSFHAFSIANCIENFRLQTVHCAGHSCRFQHDSIANTFIFYHHHHRYNHIDNNINCITIL